MTDLATLQARAEGRVPPAVAPSPEEKTPATEVASVPVGPPPSVKTIAAPPVVQSNAPAEPPVVQSNAPAEPLRAPTLAEGGMPGFPREPLKPDISVELQAAYNYHAQGFSPIPIKAGAKQAAIDKWQHTSIPLDQFPQYWGGDKPCGIAIPLGGRAKGLIDMDLDWPEARTLADQLPFLYGDLLTFGRKGAPRSHRLAMCEEALEVKDCRTLAFSIPGAIAQKLRLGDGEHAAAILELRGNNGYTIFAPTTHPSGEVIEWDNAEGRSIVDMDYTDLRNRAGLLAFLAFMVRFYPPVGVRNDFNLALGGALLRALAGKYEDDEACLIEHVDRMVTTVCRIAGDKGTGSSWEKRAAVTLAKLKGGAQVTGLPKLLEIIGVPELDKTLRKWLGAESDDRPIIEVDDDRRTETLKRVQDALLAAGLSMLQRAGAPVHVYRVKAVVPDSTIVEEDGVRREAGTLVVGPITKHRLGIYMSDAASFRVFSPFPKPHLKKCGPPDKLCEQFLSWGDQWNLPPLLGTVGAPTLRGDGSLVDTEGYDRPSGLWLDFGGLKFPSIAAAPTKDEAKAALDVLLDLLRGFPFDGNADGTTACASRSTALALILTSLVIRVLQVAPLGIIDAFAAGTGKTLLMNVIAWIATGHIAPITTLASTEEETEKRVVSSLLKGDQILGFDNVSIPITGDVLCSAISETAIEPRLLGGNVKPKISTNVLFLATGNKCTVVGDLVRRTIKCTLDANSDQPDKRVFKVNLEIEIAKRRGHIVMAALTILRAFQCSPERKEVIESLSTYGSFTRWSDLIRAPLVWLDQPDPLDNRESIADADPITVTLSALMGAWASCEGLEVGEWYSTGQIIGAAAPTTEPDFHAALAACLPRGYVSPEGLGRFLTRSFGRPIGGLVIRARKNVTTRRAEYALVKFEAPNAQRELGL